MVAKIDIETELDHDNMCKCATADIQSYTQIKDQIK